MAKFKLESLLELIPVVGPVVARLPAFIEIVEQIGETFDDENDQQTLKDALAKAQARSDDAHAALQDRLRDD